MEVPEVQHYILVGRWQTRRTHNVRHDGTTYRGGVIEQVVNEFSLEAFQQLAAAKSVEYRVCNTEAYLFASELEGLKQVTQKITSVSPVPAAPTPTK